MLFQVVVGGKEKSFTTFQVLLFLVEDLNSVLVFFFATCAPGKTKRLSFIGGEKPDIIFIIDQDP